MVRYTYTTIYIYIYIYICSILASNIKKFKHKFEEEGSKTPVLGIKLYIYNLIYIIYTIYEISKFMELNRPESVLYITYI